MDSDSDDGIEELMQLPIGTASQPYAFEPRYEGDFPSSDTGTSGSESENDNTEENLDSRLDGTEWCACGNCQVLTGFSEVDCVCCQEQDEVSQFVFLEGVKCVTLWEDFEASCLNRTVLKSILRRMKESKGNKYKVPVPNETFRWASYTQLIYTIYGTLGKGVRKVVPACVVKLVEEKYPAANGHYTRFAEAEGQDL